MASKAYKKLMKKIPQEIKDKVDIDIDYLNNQAKELKKILIKSWKEIDKDKTFFDKLVDDLISKNVRVKKENENLKYYVDTRTRKSSRKIACTIKS